MSEIRLSEWEVEKIEQQMRLDLLGREALEALKAIAAEWDADPETVTGFDLRTVQRAQSICKRAEALLTEEEAK